MKLKSAFLFLILGGALIGIWALVDIQQHKTPKTDVIFDHIRRNALSSFEPKFTQVKRVTLRQLDADNLQLTVQMSAPLRLNLQDRMLVRIHYSNYSIIFPIGYNYASSPSLPSGMVGIISYDTAKQKLLDHVPCAFNNSALTATFDKNSYLRTDQSFEYVDILYIPGSAGGLKAYYKGINMTDSAANVDSEQLDDREVAGWGMPEHAGSSWNDEKPTLLPPEVRTKVEFRNSHS